MEENIQSAPKGNTPRDLFLHLLAIVTLYWSAISFTTLIWQFIDKWFPDTLTNYYYADFSSGAIRFSVSTIIIVFPVFIAVSWYLNKIYRREAAVRESKIRKWLIYLTLFISSLIIIGDLIFVINAFLGGSPTISFTLKALSIILVVGTIFGYYLDDVRKDEPAKSAKYFALIASILVLGSIVYSFIVIGSPNTARLMQFDQQKVVDLQGIQSHVVDYWQRKGSMPNSLSDLNDSISGYSAPIDSQTNGNYEYNLKDANNLSFQLCANFNEPSNVIASDPVPVYAGIGQNWGHSAGRVCFDRTIDKQLYPQLNTVSPPVK